MEQQVLSVGVPVDPSHLGTQPEWFDLTNAPAGPDQSEEDVDVVEVDELDDEDELDGEVDELDERLSVR